MLPLHLSNLYSAQVFVIHLNRARWLLHGKKEKLQNHVLVRFVLSLELCVCILDKFCCSPKQFPVSDWSVAPFTSDVSRSSSAVPPIYDLSSVVCHHGRGIDTGHYTTYSKDIARGEWWLLLRLSCVR